MKVVIIILSIIAFIACLVIGIRAGISTPRQPSYPELTRAAQNPDQQKINILLLVDDLSMPNPALVNAWIILSSPERKFFNLLMLYPSPAGTDSSLARSLKSSFSLTSSHTFSPEFLSELEALHLQWDGYFLIDFTGLIKLIDWVGGIQMGNNTLTGAQALATLCKDCNAANEKFSSSSVLLWESLCQRSTSLTNQSAWVPVITELTPDHFITDVSLTTLMEDWKSFVGSSFPLTCQVTPVE